VDTNEWQAPPELSASASTVKSSVESKSKSISVYYCNARSIRNNLAELHVKLYDEKYSVLCFCESWLCSNFTNGMLDYQNKFNIYRRDRSAKWPAGGVCIFIEKSFDSCLNPVDNVRFPNSEIVAANIYLSPEIKLCIICTYLPPNLSPIVFHESMLYLEALFSQDDMLIVAVGDFNLPSIDWKCMIPSQDSKCTEFFDLISTHGLYQFVREPTRLNNILDLVLCNDGGLISDVEVIVPFGMSDHNAINFSIELVLGDIESLYDPTPIFMWNKGDWTNFHAYCEDIDWDDILLNEQSANELWSSFVSVIKVGIAKYVPTFTPPKNARIKRKGLSKANKKLRTKKLNF
jgi:hypothetical protein